VRRGMRYLADTKLYDEIQVFQLSVLPGTEFRRDAQQLGLEFQARPPYYVTRTKDLDLDTMIGLLEESEEIFGVEFDPLPPVEVSPLAPAHGVAREVTIDLDARPRTGVRLPRATAQALTLRLRASDLYAVLAEAEATVRDLLAVEPFTTLTLLLETNAEFPLDVLDRLRAASERAQNVYLDRFYEMTTARDAGSLRIVTLLPESLRASFDSSWIEEHEIVAEIVWISAAVTSER
jgi:hypothetical protein